MPKKKKKHSPQLADKLKDRWKCSKLEIMKQIEKYNEEIQKNNEQIEEEKRSIEILKVQKKDSEREIHENETEIAKLQVFVERNEVIIK